jgi:hypothetical protein
MKNENKFLYLWLFMLISFLLLAMFSSCNYNNPKPTTTTNKCMVFEKENGIISVCLDEISYNIIP